MTMAYMKMKTWESIGWAHFMRETGQSSGSDTWGGHNKRTSENGQGCASLNFSTLQKKGIALTFINQFF
jgi:hypothetical protein